jgi:hypothetical protein
MAAPGRNDPCPCGSGKKFKHCCLLSAQVSPLARAKRLHDFDRRLVDELFRFAVQTMQIDPFDRVAIEVDPGGSNGELIGLVVACAVYHDDLDPGDSIALHFLDECGKKLSSSEREWIELQSATRVSIYEVLDVRPGESLRLLDVIAGGEVEVVERGASQSLRKHDHVFARVVTYDGVSLLSGMYPRALRPLQAATVIDEVKRMAGIKAKRISPKKLREPEVQDELLVCWHEVVTRALTFPELANTDGDPLLPTTDKYRFDPAAREEVLSALLTIPGVSRDEGESGPGTPITLRWSRAGKMKALETVSIAMLRLTADRLDVETNSIARADTTKAALLAAAGQWLKAAGRVHSDVESIISVGMGKSPTGPEPPPPEMIAALLKAKDAHYRAWVDEPVPALGGKTPREGVKTKDGKSRVTTLLKDLAAMESRLPESERYDFSWMWRELGVPEP